MDLECWLHNLDCKPVIGNEPELAFVPSVTSPVTSFRNSSEHEGYWKDVLAHLTRFTTECAGMVHRGFLDGVLNSIEGFWTGFLDWLEMPVPDELPKDAIRKLSFSGHSLGGALATVASVICLSAIEDRRKKSVFQSQHLIAVELVTYGSPRAVSGNVAKALMKRLAVAERHVNTSDELDDPFTCMPLNFNHVGDVLKVHVGGVYKELSTKLNNSQGSNGAWISTMLQSKTIIERLHSIDVYVQGAGIFEGFAKILNEARTVALEAELATKCGTTSGWRPFASFSVIGGLETAMEEYTTAAGHVASMKTILAKEGLPALRTYATDHDLFIKYPILTTSIPRAFTTTTTTTTSCTSIKSITSERNASTTTETTFAAAATTQLPSSTTTKRRKSLFRSAMDVCRGGWRFIESLGMWQLEILQREAQHNRTSLASVYEALKLVSMESDRLQNILASTRRPLSSSSSGQHRKTKETLLLLQEQLEDVNEAVEDVRAKLHQLRSKMKKQYFSLRLLRWTAKSTTCVGHLRLATNCLCTAFGDGPNFNASTIAASESSLRKHHAIAATIEGLQHDLAFQLQILDEVANTDSISHLLLRVGEMLDVGS